MKDELKELGPDDYVLGLKRIMSIAGHGFAHFGISAMTQNQNASSKVTGVVTGTKANAFITAVALASHFF